MRIHRAASHAQQSLSLPLGPPSLCCCRRTKALQSCIAKAYASNMALFLVPGRYLVSDTLWANQTGGVADAINIVDCRFRPNTILGSTAALPQVSRLLLMVRPTVY